MSRRLYFISLLDSKTKTFRDIEITEDEYIKLDKDRTSYALSEYGEDYYIATHGGNNKIE